MKKAPRPFRVKDSALITIALGRAAHNLRELRDRVAEVPTASLHHHFFEGLLRPSFDDPEYRNDFALWARDSLRDDVLAERLALVDPFALADEREALRAALIDVLEDRLAELAQPANVQSGHEFHFMRSQIVVFDSGLAAGEPEQLAGLARHLSPGSVFYHFIDARLRPPRGEDDFSTWLRSWGDRGNDAGERLARIDPMFGSLGELRERIAEALDDAFGRRP